MAITLTQSDKQLLLSAFGQPETRDRVAELLEIAGSGDVAGPATSTDNALPRFNGTTGILLQNSTILVEDTGSLTFNTPSGAALLWATDGSGDIGSADGGSTFNRPLGIYALDSVLVATGAGESGSVFVGAGGGRVIGSDDGAFEIQAGTDGTNGGQLFVTTQAGDLGGAISIIGGGTSDNGQDGSVVNLEAGAHSGSGKGGIVTIKAGNSATGDGGDVEIYAGTGAVDGEVLIINSDLNVFTVGKGIAIKEGADAKMGVATLVGGTLVVNTTAVTANSRIFLTPQTISGVIVATAVAVSARTPATSFTISSADVADTSDIAWMIVEPL